MYGIYSVQDETGQIVSEAYSFSAARLAVRTHLEVDGYDPPLMIFAPDGKKIATGVKDECGHVLIRTTTLSAKYDKEVIGGWRFPEDPWLTVERGRGRRERSARGSASRARP